MTDLDTIVEKAVQRRASRREFVTRIGAAGLGVVAGNVLAGCGGSGGGSLFGSPAGAQGVSSAEVAKAFMDIQQDENDHVTFLKGALGASARPRPTFNTTLLTAPDLSTFITDAAALENTGTGAYPYVVTATALAGHQDVIQAAATIAIVEGRHAGFLNALKGRVLLTDPNQNDAVGPPASDLSREVIQAPSQVKTRAAAFLGTVAAAPGAGVDTSLNGGAGFPPDDNSEDLNTILNYALLLEYLERDFYNINVHKFFGGTGPVYSPTGP